MTGLPIPAPGSASARLLHKNAAEFVARLVLGTLRPPWLTDAHPDERHTWAALRHSFLQWPKNKANVFGDELIACLQSRCAAEGLSFVGVAAQPAFVCTAARAQQANPDSRKLPCGRRAVMSPLVAGSADQKLWRCDLCAALRDDGNESSKRMLVLWPLISTENGRATIMRGQNIDAVVSAPPPSWQWKAGTTSVCPVMENCIGSPRSMELHKGRRFLYNDSWSDAIWISSSRYAP